MKSSLITKDESKDQWRWARKIQFLTFRMVQSCMCKIHSMVVSSSRLENLEHRFWWLLNMVALINYRSKFGYVFSKVYSDPQILRFCKYLAKSGFNHKTWPLVSPKFLAFHCLRWEVTVSSRPVNKQQHWVIFYCKYILHLCLFICQWTFRLLLCPGCS